MGDARSSSAFSHSGAPREEQGGCESEGEGEGGGRRDRQTEGRRRVVAGGRASWPLGRLLHAAAGPCGCMVIRRWLRHRPPLVGKVASRPRSIHVQRSTVRRPVPKYPASLSLCPTPLTPLASPLHHTATVRFYSRPRCYGCSRRHSGPPTFTFGDFACPMRDVVTHLKSAVDQDPPPLTSAGGTPG